MIFLDIDGVIVDFMGGVEKAFDVKINWDKHQGVYDLCKILDVELIDFWKKIDYPQFWVELKTYDGFHEFLDELMSLDNEIYFCTTPSRNTSSYTGKHIWFHQNIYTSFQSSFVKPPKLILINNKHLLSQSGRILVDDNDDNITKWNKAGGSGIGFPQNWNKLYRSASMASKLKYAIILDTITHLKRFIQRK